MGSIYFGNDKIKKIYIGGQKIKKVYLGSTKVWSGASIVTYICNGSRYTEEIDEGSNAARPSGFSFNVPNAKFIGWTSIPNSTNPVSNIPATGEPMTLYAIWKYDDVVISTTRFDKNMEIGYPETWNADNIFSGNIDLSKYKSLSTFVYGSSRSNFAPSGWKIWLKCGGGATQIMEPYVTPPDLGSVQHPSYCESTFSVIFANSSGNSPLSVVIENTNWNGGNGFCYVQFSNRVINLVGRTKVG